MTTRATGNSWEDAALRHVQNAGLVLVERNYHCRFGEIDLILREADVVVFAEVRYRGERAHGDGAASVGSAKQRRIVRAAQSWLQQNPRMAQAPCRFDVIGCSGTPVQAQFDWIRDAFDASCVHVTS